MALFHWTAEGRPPAVFKKTPGARGCPGFSRLLFFSLAIFCVFFSADCRTLQPVVRAPVFSFHAVELAALDFEEVKLLCGVSVENPNAFTIPFPEIDWEFFVNGNSFIAGTVKNNKPLKARTVTVVEIPVRAAYADLYNTVASLADSGEAVYRIEAAAKIGLPVFGSRVWHFEHSGVLPLLKAPGLEFKGIALKSLGLNQMEFELAWAVENKNTFALNITELNYTLQVNNSPWSAGQVRKGTVLEAGKKTTVPLIISISGLNMIREITDLITRGADAAFVCGGSIKMSGDVPGLRDLDIPFHFSGTTRLRR